MDFFTGFTHFLDGFLAIHRYIDTLLDDPSIKEYFSDIIMKHEIFIYSVRSRSRGRWKRERERGRGVREKLNAVKNKKRPDLHEKCPSFTLPAYHPVNDCSEQATCDSGWHRSE